MKIDYFGTGMFAYELINNSFWSVREWKYTFDLMLVYGGRMRCLFLFEDRRRSPCFIFSFGIAGLAKLVAIHRRKTNLVLYSSELNWKRERMMATKQREKDLKRLL